MKTIAAALSAALFASAAQAVAPPSHSFEFSGHPDSETGGLSMTEGAGANYVGAGSPHGGLRFAANQGPAVSGAFANPGIYSLEIFFSLDQLSNYRRLVDFKNGVGDSGLYLNDGDLSFYGPTGRVDTNYAAGEMLHIVLTRDADKVVRGYGQGAELFSFNDTTGHDFGVFSGPDGIARFFRDNGSEASSGFVDFIRIYDRVLTTAEVGQLYGGGTPVRAFDAPVAAVPEPSIWAMLILGFGVAGAAMRGRRAALPTLA